MNGARAGFYWWELDLTYCVLRLLALTGIIWDLHPVPLKVLEEGRTFGRLSKTTVDNVTNELK
jgi:stearoyl-CoA desaturase (delta-9 desaturase)